MVSLWWVTYPSGKNVKNGLIMMGDLPKWKECEVQSHYNGWPTQMEDKKNMKWSHCNGWPTQMEDEKNVKWSHCNGWPTQVEDRKMWSGRVIMGDLPRWKIEKMWSGRVIMGDLPTWKMVVSLWWVTYPEKMMFLFFKKMVSLLRVTYPKIECDLPGKKTWLEQSWQDKADKLGTFWLQVDLKTPWWRG